MLKKIVSGIVAVSFLLNTVSSGYALAPQSRMEPVTNPEMLDIMKLTAAAVEQGIKGDIGIREKATSTTLPPAQVQAVSSTGTKVWFPDIKAFKYEGPDAKNKRAFQWYDPNGNIDGRPMKDVFRFSMAWWHAMRGEGSDIFGGPSKTLPWLQNPDPMQRARDTVDAGFELMSKLGIPFYAFHDRDVAPEATKADGTIDVAQSEKNLREIAAYLKQKQDETGIKLLWGTANLFSNRRFMNGAATNPDLAVLLHSAAQVKAVLEVTNELGGANYVLWGGREGYYSLINTATDKELDNLAQFLKMVRDHAKKIGFKGKLMIEPKAKEPTGHQYDYDAATVMGFLRKYGLEKDFFLNIEPNHAALAGHTGQHDLQVAADNGTFNGLDANSGVMPGAPQLGWDTDHFPGLSDALEAMLVIDKIGGFTSGGVHFDAKTHRTSTDREDIFIAHALGMDSYVLAHIIAKSYLADSEVQEFLKDRYASYDTELGKRFKDGKLTLEDAAKLAAEIGEPVQKSGKLEFLQRKLQQHMIMAPVQYFISQRNARSEYTHEKIDEVTEKTAPKELTRSGDEIVFDYRHKVVVGDTEFIPSWIKGVKHGEKAVTTRHYLCRANKIEGGKYDYEFMPDRGADLKGLSVADVVKDSALLSSLAKKSRSADVKEGITRFTTQQEVDRYIANVITGKVDGVKETRIFLDSEFVREVVEFLLHNSFKVTDSFEDLVMFGQLMIIPGLDIPHAGGMGIYLPDKPQYRNAETLIHEIFAKCGMSNVEAEDMAKLFVRTRDNAGLISADNLRMALLKKARNVDFPNRYDDVLNIDFYKDGFQVPVSTLLSPSANWFLGIDSSTKSVKFFVIERIGNTNRIIWTHTESFNSPYYMETFGTKDGVLPHPQAPEQYHTDPLMIADALDRGMAQLSQQFKANNLLLSNLKAIAGAGQQHGTVYLNNNAKDIGLLLYEKPLWENLHDKNILALPTSPIWQDGTPAEEVREIHEAAGGEQAVREMTGSKGTLRFSLPQALAVFTRSPQARRDTRTVINIAGWNLGLLCGNLMWDPGDALGTNAANAKEKRWWIELMNKLSPGLGDKFAPIMPSDHIAGTLLDYWVKKYGFSRDTKVVNFTGDNPSGLTGMGVIKEGDVVVSLGTSYTAYTFVPTEKLEHALKTPIGHIFGEPTGQYMNLVCFQNGDDTLVKIREKYITEAEALRCAVSQGKTVPSDKAARDALIKEARLWIFTDELAQTEPGNNGAMMVAMHKTEDVVRIPFIEGKTFTRGLDEKNRPQVFRAAVEGQAYFLKYVAEQINLDVKRIKLTGGVSNNPVVRQIMADVFGAEINVLAVSEAVAMGSAIRAMKAGLGISWEDAIKDLTNVDETQTVKPVNAEMYRVLYPKFVELLNETIKTSRAEETPAEAATGQVDVLVSEYGVKATGVMFNRNQALTLTRTLPEVTVSAAPEIESATIVPDYGMNLVSWKVRLPGQMEATEVLATSPLKMLRDKYKVGPGNEFGKNPFAGEAGAVIGPLPNRFVGPVANGEVEITLPNGAKASVPANHDGTKTPKLHLHGFFHNLAQAVRAWYKKDGYSSIGGIVDVKGRSKEWPWPSDSNISSRRTVEGNKLLTQVVQANTGDEDTWASWVEHSYFKHLPGVARGDVRLKLPATAMTPVSLDADGKPDYKECLPTGEIRNLAGTEYARFMAPEGGELGDTFFDDSFTNLVPQADGSVVVEVLYPKAGVKLRIKAYDKVTRKDGSVETGKLKTVQVYSPNTSEFVCVEIGNHLNNPFDKNTWGDRDTGMVKLSPGDKYEYNLEYEYLPIEEMKVESKTAVSAAERLKALLNGPFGHADLEKIDATVDELVLNEREEAIRILREGDGKTANCILDRIAVYEGYSKILHIDHGIYLTRLLVAAEQNSAFGVKGRAEAISLMQAHLLKDEFAPIAMPKESTDLEDARRITNSEVYKIVAPITMESIRTFGSLVNVAKPQRTTLLERHTTAVQYFLVTEGELVLLAAAPWSRKIMAYVVKKGEAVRVDPNIWHMSVTTSPDTKFIVYNQEKDRQNNNPTPPTEFACIGSVYEIGAPAAALPEGIDETVIDLAAAESSTQKTVVFMSQDFAVSADSCKELLPNFSNVEYVPFNQYTQFGDLTSIVSKPKYDGCRKVLIMSGTNPTHMERVITGNEAAFKDVIPMNIAAEKFASVTEQKSFQKGILSMAILAVSVSKDKAAYKQSRSYMVLKSLLTKIFGTEKEADDYISNLVNPDGTLTVSTRFGFLIGRIIGPVKKLVVDGFTRIVNIFA